MTTTVLHRQIDRLQCPLCANGALAYRDAEIGLTCSSCDARYPVVNGVPRFVGEEHYAHSFGMQWNRHRRTQLDSHTGLPLSRNRLFQVTGWDQDLRGQTILEAGSGAGRFTEVLAGTGADILSFDLSTAVEANFTNNGRFANVLIFQADMSAIPVRRFSMDKVLCLGVLQHTPDPATSFRLLAECVRSGGELVIDVYSARLRSVISWKYALRPFTRRMNKDLLYRLIVRAAPLLVPLSARLHRWLGRAGPRLLPIVQYEHLGLPPALNREWAVLDTFDMYAPAHDYPQTRRTVQEWYRDVGFVDVTVAYGPNGIIARGRRP